MSLFAPLTARAEVSHRRSPHGRRRAPSTVALLAALVLSSLSPALAASQRPADLPPLPWPAELGEAFELYYAGEFLEVQRVCRQIGKQTHDPVLRRESDALAVLATMRLSDRNSRVLGRARLAELADEDASLLTRPECQLAYGIAQTALSETAAALHHLSHAAQGFASRGQTDRLAEACVALAEAWSRHGEWELAVPGLEVRQPENRADANRIRIERIRALRHRVAALPNAEAQLARIDLLLARQLLETDDTAAEGVTLLEKAASAKTLTAATADACLALAERCETERRWADAVRLYRRVQAGGLGEASRTAERRCNAIERPQLTMDVPRQVAAGGLVTVKLKARNVSAVEFEVRRVDLGQWLKERQGRFAEGALPTSGALIAVRSLNAAVATEHDWWCSDTLTEPLTFAAPIGPVVVLARAADGAVTTKRLVIASDLQAIVFVGQRRALLWATHRGQLVVDADQDALTARFWMHGSFVPTEAYFTDGVATFALPSEARLLRDKRWVCLVEAGERVALCEGLLPPAAGSRELEPAVALTGGPPELHVGEELHVFGLLLGESGDPRAPHWPKAVDLELRDTLERAYDGVTVEVSPAGTFATRFGIRPSLAGRHLRVHARLGGHVLQNVWHPLAARVLPVDQASFDVNCNVPDWLPPPVAGVAGHIEALYPWGVAVSGAAANVSFRAVRLPTVEPRRTWVRSLAIIDAAGLDARGRWEFVQPLASFRLPEGPLAVGIWANVAGWDGRQRREFAQMLVAEEPVHLWLRCTPDLPRVGEPLHVSVGWFDPTGRASGAHPTVVVRRDDAVLAELQLLPTVNGLRSQTWRPTAPGLYELVARLPVGDAEPLVARETIRVAGRRATDELKLTPVRVTARLARNDRQPEVRVRVEGRRPWPVLTLVVGDDPIAAAQLPLLDTSADVVIPVRGPCRPATRVLLVALDSEGPEILGATEVIPADDAVLTLACSVGPHPSQTVSDLIVNVVATCGRAAGPAHDATFMARLVRVPRHGAVPWVPGDARADLGLLPGGVEAFHTAVNGVPQPPSGISHGAIPETRELPAQLARALFEHATLWVGSKTSAEGTATFRVPMPPRPGLYRLIVVAWTPDGAFACEEWDLDTRDELQLIADVPAHLIAGDRSDASLLIRNRRPAITQVRVTCSGNSELHVDEPRPVDRQVEFRRLAGASCTLAIPGSGAVRLRAPIEAARSGTGIAAFTVETERGAQRVSASCEIRGASSIEVATDAAPAERLVVQRDLFMLEQDAVAGEGEYAAVGSGPEAGWIRVPVEPGERLVPGDLLLIQEQFTLKQELAGVEWEQRLPGNCLTHAQLPDQIQLRQVGRRRDLRIEALTHVALRLAAGRPYMHEYVIVAVRPGACQFPAPSVRAGGVPVHVEVASRTPRVLVADAD